MWQDIDKVNWAGLHHAYGKAVDVPKILRQMVAQDVKERENGWSNFWGSLNHQGDYYNSTVAAIPFLIEACANPAVPQRQEILIALRDRWLSAPDYGGDPFIPEPPGGCDEPTPVIQVSEPGKSADLVSSIAKSALRIGASPGGTDIEDSASDDENDDDFCHLHRRMDLCAWQTAKAVEFGKPTFQKILTDGDLKVAAAAAVLLLLFPDSRNAAKETLASIIRKSADPLESARNILELGVYGSKDDAALFEELCAEDRPAMVRAAAALAYAWSIDPEPLPSHIEEVLNQCSECDCDAFVKLPQAGLFNEGTWNLPSNAGRLLLRLADNSNKELRWRAVQGLDERYEAVHRLPADSVIEVLVRRLTDPYNRIRDAASGALAQQGAKALEVNPEIGKHLINALKHTNSANWGDDHDMLDTGSSTCGHSARLLVALYPLLSPEEREEAELAIDEAIGHYSNRKGEYVIFFSSWKELAPFLEEQKQKLRNSDPSLAQLFEVLPFGESEGELVSIIASESHLANLYATAPQVVLEAAGALLRSARERNAAMGAALWLMSLGPSAEPFLLDLDVFSNSKVDEYARKEVASAASFIRESMKVIPLITFETAPEGEELRRLVHIKGKLHENSITDDQAEEFLSELPAFFKSADVKVRATAAALVEALLSRCEANRHVTSLVAYAEPLLADGDSFEVGIAGEFKLDGRLHHWRKERRSARNSAIRILHALRYNCTSSMLLSAMVEESKEPAVFAGKQAIPNRFSLDLWRLAVQGAGGLPIADPIIRRARQMCQVQEWPGHNGPFACAEELSSVVRLLSGRRIK